MKNKTIPGEMALGTAVRSASGLNKLMELKREFYWISEFNTVTKVYIGICKIFPLMNTYHT